MPAISAKNSTGLTITNCDFIGFETAIELENVSGFVSKNNNFSKGNNPQLILNALSKEIFDSNLDKSSKERLAQKIITALSNKETLKKEESAIKNSLKYIGNKAVDLFIQIAAAVAAGLVIKGQ